MLVTVISFSIVLNPYIINQRDLDIEFSFADKIFQQNKLKFNDQNLF